VRPVLRWFPGGGGRRARRLAAAWGIAAAALATSRPPAWAVTAETAENEIRAALENWRSAFNDRDEQQVCDIFAPDVIANYEGEPERDFASLCQMLQTTVQDRERTYRYSLKINDILVYGDTAIVRVVWTLEIDKINASKEIIEEPAVDIFRLQADQSWKISRYFAYASSP
jgi:ketosteroid isomerase-like protein